MPLPIGLVEKNGCPNDKRLVDVLLTEKALELLETVNKKNEEINKVLDGLNEGEVNQLNGLLDKGLVADCFRALPPLILASSHEIFATGAACVLTHAHASIPRPYICWLRSR